MTISQVNKLGKTIRKQLKQEGIVTNDSLVTLQEYRLSHQDALRQTFDFLAEKSKQHYKGSVVSYRLKRIDTILRKIRREETMAFSRMQDIAGCRSIVYSINQIYLIASEFQKSQEYEVLYVNDYVERPRESGYISYHIIVKPLHSDVCVEIQLRTQLHHYWATLVEITDLLFGIKLKEGQDHPDLFNFHRLLAKGQYDLTLEEKKELIEIEKKHDILIRLTSVFRSNYYEALKRWLQARDNGKSPYLIIQVDENLTPDFTFFTSFEQAEIEYFNRFSISEPNMVLIHMNKLDFKRLSLAYSNYVLTSHASIRYFLTILQDYIIESKQNYDKEADMAYSHYKKIYSEILSSFNAEIDYMNNILKRYALIEYSVEMIKDWRDNLLERIKFIDTKNKDFNINIDAIPPEPIERRIMRFFRRDN